MECGVAVARSSTVFSSRKAVVFRCVVISDRGEPARITAALSKPGGVARVPDGCAAHRNPLVLGVDVPSRTNFEESRDPPSW